MRDLVSISNEDVPELTGLQQLRMFSAFSIAVACGVVSLQGIAILFTEAEIVALPGMDQLGGQISWATALVGMLVAVTFLVRGVIRRRLQWAIAISLAMHFLLCVSISVVQFRSLKPIPAQEAALSGEIPEEFTLPDYAGEEVPRDDSAWRQQNDTVTPENNVDVARSEIEISEAEKPQPVDATQAQDVEKLDSPERPVQVQLAADAAAEMQRRASESDVPIPQQADQPAVSTSDIVQPTIDAQIEQPKQSSEAPTTEREQSEIAAANQQIEAAEMQAQRSESVSDPEDVQASLDPKTTANAKAAMAANEEINVATEAAPQLNAREQQSDIARQQAALTGSKSESTPSDTRASSGNPAISSARPDRAAGLGDPNAAAPASGGSVSMARTGGTSGAPGAVDSSAQNVEVSSAGGVGVPVLAESSDASASGRGSAASVPAGSASNGSTSVAGAAMSDGEISGTSVARSANGGDRPALGNASGNPSMVGRGEGRQASAVGTSAANVGVARVGDSRAKAGESIVAGPASTSIGRSTNGLPSGTRSGGTANGVSSPTSSGASPTGPARTAVAATGRGTEPSAMLNPDAGFAGGSGTGIKMARSSATPSGMSAGAVAAEQGGSLVFAGPQAVAGGGTAAGGALSGPRMNSVPRRSAGLPGSNGPVGGTTTSAVTGTQQPSRVAVGSPRSGIGNDRPVLASADVLAGLIRKSVPGIGGSPEARIADSLSMRNTDARREAAKTLGGSPESEEAVERGLAWLARIQYPDGHWSINSFPGDHPADTGKIGFRSDSAATGLALLAYLGAGYTHQSGNYQDVVNRGMAWLLKGQKPDGDLFVDESEFVWFYSHGIASIAVCEAYGLTKDEALREPAQRALNFIVASQHPEFGGWRYRPKFESDTSVSGWQLMALKSGEMSGLNVPKTAYVGVGKWLDSVQSKSSPGQFSYHPSQDASLAMTAEGLLMRQYLGTRRNDPQLIAGANYLRTRLPDFGQRDSYYWYYATQVMFHMQGEHWSDWNASLRDTLVSAQTKDGPNSGSWDPAGPTPEKWAGGGGRHYVTCLDLLMLEVYYRHLPLYLELEK